MGGRSRRCPDDSAQRDDKHHDRNGGSRKKWQPLEQPLYRRDVLRHVQLLDAQAPDGSEASRSWARTSVQYSASTMMRQAPVTQTQRSATVGDGQMLVVETRGAAPSREIYRRMPYHENYEHLKGEDGRDDHVVQPVHATGAE